MRCEQCGRPMKNAEMWQLSGDREAPSARSLRQLCWDCRQEAGSRADAEHAERVRRSEQGAERAEVPVPAAEESAEARSA